ncbi:MAG: YchJ family protein [Psychrobium sp.]
MNLSQCPCGSNQLYPDCCQPFHKGHKLPETAQQLMRSRYCAFVTDDCDYIYATHSPQTRHTVSLSSIKEWNQQCSWLGLQIIEQAKDNQVQDNQFRENKVEFVAWYKQNNTLQFHHEVSRFETRTIDDELAQRVTKITDKCWYYLDATYPENAIKIPSRNDKCFCNSGKKFKKCCGS